MRCAPHRKARDTAVTRDLRDHLKLEQEAARSGDHERLIHLLGEFHIKLARSLNNPVLLDWFCQLISRASLYAATLKTDYHPLKHLIEV
ncbi:FCD domain-containing protein [Pseudomonas sp. ok272]|nr:FCD domain-containing protein [Pseudomonas sp. ok272]SFM86892.1 FCD domain-containing protein [Pseudomonas sp. ok602]